MCGEGFMWLRPSAKWQAAVPFYCNLYCEIHFKDTYGTVQENWKMILSSPHPI